MEDQATSSFLGFQSSLHRDEMEYDEVLTRLQRRAPAPLPLDKQSAFPFLTVDCPQTCPARFGSSTASVSSGSGSFKKGGAKKDPIPLLTPLVSPTAGLGQQQKQKQGISSLCFGRHGD
ncbi:hypothetical protein LINPERPRIM_LOCUS38283 [Linum perenne]